MCLSEEKTLSHWIEALLPACKLNSSASCETVCACSDSAVVTIYDQKIAKEKLPYIKLLVFPPDKLLETSFKKLYRFDDNCEIVLHVEKKGGITCNSTHNTAKRILSKFPSSYFSIKVQLLSIAIILI